MKLAMLTRCLLQEGVVRLSAEPKEYSIAMLRMPPGAAYAISKLRARIDKNDLSEDGFEADPHITVKYGLHAESPEELEDLVAGFGPVTVSITTTSLFENEHDVLKLGVTGDIYRLNELVCELPHTDTFPTYSPHITLAYLKKGAGHKYIGMDDLNGLRVTFDTLVFSDRHRNEHIISLR